MSSLIDKEKRINRLKHKRKVLKSDLNDLEIEIWDLGEELEELENE